MKKLFALSLFLVSFSSFGQNFGAVGSEWYFNFMAPDNAWPPTISYISMKSVGTALVNGKTTYQLDGFSASDMSGSMPGSMFVYQQSDTVYYYHAGLSKFMSLYIFNQNVGDTLTLDAAEPRWQTTDSTYRLVITAIDTLLVNGIPLKKYTTDPLDHYQYHGSAFMDRIGSLTWPLPVIAFIATGVYGPLRCFSDSEVSINFTNDPCDYKQVLSSPDGLSGEQFRVSPNPFTNQLSLQFPEALTESVSVNIYDLQGRVLYVSEQKSLADKGVTLNLPELPAGLYFMRVSNQNRGYTTKIVKQ